MKIKVKLNLPEEFVVASQLFNVDVEAALQSYLNHISIYQSLSSPNDETGTLASTIFNHAIPALMVGDGTDGANPNRAIHAKYKKNVSFLIEGHAGPANTTYRYIVDRWFDEVPNPRWLSVVDD